MAYERQNWVNGTTICNAERMNHIEDGITDLYNAIFPVGQIVIKGDNKDYSNWLGFTWERTAVGKVLVGIDSTDTDFNTIGKTSGEKAHKLTIDEMPSHTHYLYNSAGGSIQFPAYTSKDNGTNGSTATNGYASSTGISGSSQPHNNLQPYQVVAYWKRIA